MPKAKQSDVARLAGVSQTTVSQVLNNAAAFSVPQETRQRVIDAVTQLRYIPNGVARSLRTQKTLTIASVIPDIANPFYPALERGVQDVAEARGYDLIVYNTDGQADKERRCLESLLRGRVDGVIGVFFHLTSAELQRLRAGGIAAVLLDEPGVHPDLGYDRVYVDNAKAARAAVTYLLERGHTRISMLSGPQGTLASRAEGYVQALRAYPGAAEPHIIDTPDFTEACGYVGMERALATSPRPDAVFAANDLLAMGALRALREAGVRVPQDMALLGFDDIPVARLLTPALTTVSQFQEGLGRRAAELLFERLDGRAPEHGRDEEMPFELMVRESA